MAEPLQMILERGVQGVERSYYRLVLLVGPERSGKNEILKLLSSETGLSVVNVNLLLSEKLL